MNWRIKHARAFYKETTKLPAKTRKKVEAIAFGEDIKQDPFLQGKVQKLKGHSNYYRVRVGNYRIGLYIDLTDEVVEFRRVLHRKDIYRRFP